MTFLTPSILEETSSILNLSNYAAQKAKRFSNECLSYPKDEYSSVVEKTLLSLNQKVEEYKKFAHDLKKATYQIRKTSLSTDAKEAKKLMADIATYIDLLESISIKRSPHKFPKNIIKEECIENNEDDFFP